ncbi:uncharacterized protein LOC112466535 [Temnothorax curvispinosus]|uniref:Uncharacterized protein LOC112466535 n=1 Tax=Temnothorax curvispinosus TaxID=300111 RepID=A0A6J1R891_9HYME|nr:uncharacterized protein LOC112466535 [Temnothorax curvispinosus]
MTTTVKVGYEESFVSISNSTGRNLSSPESEEQRVLRKGFKEWRKSQSKIQKTRGGHFAEIDRSLAANRRRADTSRRTISDKTHPLKVAVPIKSRDKRLRRRIRNK